MTGRKFEPFGEDDCAAFSIAGLQVENAQGSVEVFGTLSLRRDQRSRAAALSLAALLQDVAASIGEDAPEEASGQDAVVLEEVANPFA